MIDACTWAAGEHGCDLDVDVYEMFRGYRQAAELARSVAVARRALERRGHEPREVATGGGSDANALIAAGFEACCSRTGPRPTTRREESVAAARIVEMLEVCEAIVDAARRGRRLMLKLRRGRVVDDEPLVSRWTASGAGRGPTTALVGEVEAGDEVVVNVEAHDLGLGSGGFDVVHVNLTRGLDGDGRRRRHVMKLNYTSLQHPVEPVEGPRRERRSGARSRRRCS